MLKKCYLTGFLETKMISEGLLSTIKKQKQLNRIHHEKNNVNRSACRIMYDARI